MSTKGHSTQTIVEVYVTHIVDIMEFNRTLSQS